MHERRHSGEVIVPHFGTLSTRTSEMGNRLVEVALDELREATA